MKYFKYILGFLIIFVPCVIAVLIYNDKITQNSPVYYKQGIMYYNDGDYANAYYNFGKINRISPLYSIALYKQAKSAQKAGDYKTAALKYQMFLEKSPDSAFDTTAKLNLAKSYFYTKQFDEAKVIFENLMQKTNHAGTEEVYFLGLIEKNKDKRKAAAYFENYLEAVLNGSANGRYIMQSAEELAALGINLTNNDNYLIGKAYFKNGRYEDALKYFSKIPEGDCWDYFVLSNHYAGNKVIAKKMIENGLSLYSNSASEDNLRKIYNIYSSYLSGTKLKNWNYIYKMIKDMPVKGKDYVMYKIAAIVPQEKSLFYYRGIIEQYPQSRYASDALWNIFWNEYKQKNYKTAEELAFRHIKDYKKTKSSAKMIFWLAKTLLKENKTQEAHFYLSKLVSKYPDDYYALRSEYLLNKRADFWNSDKINKIPSQKQDIEFPISISQIDIKDIKIIDTLFETGDYEIWSDISFDNTFVESWFEFKKDKKSHSVVLARDEIEKTETKPLFIDAVYKLAYPLYWTDEINIAGKKLGLDPYLILSVIREESYFNEHAKSKTGATGLMQLMPQTANYMISKLTDDINTLADLENPRINIYLGCNYLNYLKERFNDDLMMIAAYNGGEGSVSKWLRTYNTDDYDEFIEDIPFEETRNYVKKVFKTYRIYGKIYK